MELNNGKELEELNVSHNCLTQVTEELCKLTTLTTIDLSFNYIRSLPNLSGSPNLETLIVSHNEMDEFPKLSGCIRLTLLDLSHNKLNEISVNNLKDCPIKLLLLGENNLRQLPEDISKLKTLYNLDLHSNRIKYIPYEMSLLTNLTLMNLDGNPITNIDDDALESCDLTLTFLMKELLKYTRINDKDLLRKRNINLKSLLTEDEDLNNSENLIIREQNLLTVFDSTFENVIEHKIRRVDLSKNSISYVPFGIIILKKTVETLILKENRLKSIPEYISQLERLSYLDLSNNDLNDLPEGLKEVRLSVLLVANNRFKNIVAPVYSLKGLRRLDFSGNMITDIDTPHLKMLTCLKTLHLSNNLIEHVPLSLASLTNLRRLTLFGNPIVFPDRSVLEDGVEAIMICLRKKQIEEKGDGTRIL